MATISARQVIRHMSNLVNYPLQQRGFSDTELLSFLRLAYSDTNRFLRIQDVSIFRKESTLVAVPPTATSITSSAQVGTAASGTPGLNDATGSITTYTGTTTAVYEVEIDANGAPDTFKWKVALNGGAYGTSTTGVNCAVSPGTQMGTTGVYVSFAATTGHTIGDKWRIYVYFYPSNLLRPIELRERTSTYTGTVGTYTLMNLNDGFVPDETATTTGKLFDWRDLTIVLKACTLERDIQLQYEGDVGEITSPTDTLYIPEGLSILAFRGAAYACQARMTEGDPQRADLFNKQADDALARVMNNEREVRRAKGGRWGVTT